MQNLWRTHLQNYETNVKMWKSQGLIWESKEQCKKYEDLRFICKIMKSCKKNKKECGGLFENFDIMWKSEKLEGLIAKILKFVKKIRIERANVQECHKRD